MYSRGCTKAIGLTARRLRAFSDLEKYSVTDMDDIEIVSSSTCGHACLDFVVADLVVPNEKREVECAIGLMLS